MIKIAFQGMPGAYSELAARNYYKTRVETIPHREFIQVFSAVVRKKVDFGILPLENSSAGSIHENYDHLLHHKTWICGEIKLRVEHNLIGKPGAQLKKIRKVYSHPQALAQCAKTLADLKHVEKLPVFDTAGSVKMIMDDDDMGKAAIASSLAAKVYGAEILKSNIEDNHENYTRFVIIGKQRQRPSRRHPIKTSIVYALKNIPGALFKSLSVFAIRDIDLLKIESRPIPGSPWKYIFYLDFAADAESVAGANSIRHLEEISEFVRVLGSYSADL